MWLLALAAWGADDPLRWLEDPDSEEVVAWRDARNAETLAWLGPDARDARIAELASLDDDRGVHLVARDHRGGTTVWLRWTEHDLTPEELAQRAPHDPRTQRWEMTLFAQRAGTPVPGQPLEAPGVIPDASLCSVDVSPDGRRVVWRRRPYERVPPEKRRLEACQTWTADLLTGEIRYLGPVRGNVRFDPADSDVLLTMRQDSKRRRTHVECIDLRDGSVTPKMSGRGSVWWSRLPDGTEMLWRSKGRRLHIDWGDTTMRLPRRRTHWAGWHDGRMVLRHVQRDDRVRVVAVDPDAPRKRDWEQLAIDTDENPFRSVAVHEGTLLLGIRRDGAVAFEERPIDDASTPGHEPLDGQFSMIWPGRTLEPVTLVRGMQPQGSKAWLRSADGAYQELEGPRFADHVVFETVRVTGPDGTDIPVSLQRPISSSGPAPLWVQVYGGFGHASRAGGGLVAERFVAAGGIIATVHARGGDERGEAWHEAATKRDLEVTYDDVHAAVTGLIEQGLTERGRVVLSGASNGGLTSMATLLRDPDLYAGVIATAGVFDLLRGPAMGRWWPKEYGSPNVAAQREVLARISPVHAEPPRLPPVLIVTGQEDPTVTPSHSYKLAAAWAEVEGGPVLLRATSWPSHLHHLDDKERHEAINARPADADEQSMADTELFLERVLDLSLAGR